MIDDLSDKEQVELIKKWWRTHGWSIVLAVVIGLSLGFGWRYWNQYKVTRNDTASQLYMELVSMDYEKQAKQMQQIVERLDAKYQATPYPAFAHLIMAKGQVSAHHYDKAIGQLDWVISHSKVEDFQDMAIVRKARILAAQKHYDQAVSVLGTINNTAYAAMIATVKGDIYNAQGDTKQAKEQYAIASKALTDVGAKDPLLAMKQAQFNGSTLAATNTAPQDKADQ